MNIELKILSEISAVSWQEVMQLRSEIFVQEQQCVYTDPDSHDFDAVHLMCRIGGDLAGYMRIINHEQIHFGRIAVAKQFRNQGIAKALIDTSLAWSSKFPSKSIEMSAQVYLSDYYKNLGFQPVGPMYLEDGIPHIKLVCAQNP